MIRITPVKISLILVGLLLSGPAKAADIPDIITLKRAYPRELKRDIKPMLKLLQRAYSKSDMGYCDMLPQPLVQTYTMKDYEGHRAPKRSDWNQYCKALVHKDVQQCPGYTSDILNLRSSCKEFFSALKGSKNSSPGYCLEQFKAGAVKPSEVQTCLQQWKIKAFGRQKSPDDILNSRKNVKPFTRLELELLSCFENNRKAGRTQKFNQCFFTLSQKWRSPLICDFCNEASRCKSHLRKHLKGKK